MFKYAQPSQVGVSAKDIKKYVSVLEKYGLSTHSVIMARGDKIFFEKYWAPFDKDFRHRMYSVTKSLVSIAIGFLEQDGLISLDDKIVKYFPKDVPEDIHINVKNQTVRDMLMMSTGFSSSYNMWFLKRPEDRVKYYFDVSKAGKINQTDFSRQPGAFFEYDSNGSFILGTLIERVTGRRLLDYLDDKLFKKIGVTSAKFLDCPGGHTWSDSSLICTPLDMLKIARFTLNYGSWENEQLLSSDYLKAATGKQIDNSMMGILAADTLGYGYQFWRTWQDSFFFNGMGCQFMVCVPHKDLILIYNGDNQGNENAKSVIIDRFFEEIADNASETIKENDGFYQNELDEYCKTLKLHTTVGNDASEMSGKINGKTFYLSKNPMGISKIKFNFNGDEGNIEYTNKQGEKTLDFGIGKNVFSHFPEEGYSDTVGSKFCAGHYYKCAASAAWTEENRFGIAVQVIDEYFGRLYMSFFFKTENTVALNFTKSAEDFLDEYQGYADGAAAGC